MCHCSARCRYEQPFGQPQAIACLPGQKPAAACAGEALQTGMRPVAVVVGANKDDIKQQIEEMGVEVVDNEGWREGMASSLRCGLTAVQKIKPETDGIIFMVCDQPYVTKSVLDNLLRAQHETGLPVVTSSYDDKLWWNTLMMLPLYYFQRGI